MANRVARYHADHTNQKYTLPVFIVNWRSKQTMSNLRLLILNRHCCTCMVVIWGYYRKLPAITICRLISQALKILNRHY